MPSRLPTIPRPLARRFALAATLAAPLVLDVVGCAPSPLAARGAASPTDPTATEAPWSRNDDPSVVLAAPPHHHHDHGDDAVRDAVRDDGTRGDERAADASTGVTYACPMHPEVVAGEPGKCPKCGMKLVARPSASASSSAP